MAGKIIIVLFLALASFGVFFGGASVVVFNIYITETEASKATVIELK